MSLVFHLIIFFNLPQFILRPLESAEENARRLTQNPDLILPHPECCEFKNPCIECPFCDVSFTVFWSKCLEEHMPLSKYLDQLNCNSLYESSCFKIVLCSS